MVRSFTSVCGQGDVRLAVGWEGLILNGLMCHKISISHFKAEYCPQKIACHDLPDIALKICELIVLQKIDINNN